MKTRFKAFTLVEMLIVIVIIGILIAGFSSKLTGVTGAANDIARKTNIQTVANALLTYNFSEGEYPPSSDNCVDSLKGKLNNLNTIPGDPNKSQTYGPCKTKGSYIYRPLDKADGAKNDGMIIGAKMENPKNANFVYRDDMKGMSFADLQSKICDRSCNFSNGQPYFVVIQ